jgi:sugar lactone lactonase YvrE
VLLWLFLRYLEGGESKYLLWITLITALHYADKATSFIFSAEALIFLALLFIVESLRKPWRERQYRANFLFMTLVALLAVLAGAALYLLTKGIAAGSTLIPFGIIGSVLLAALVFMILWLIRGLGWKEIRSTRSFDLVVLQLLLILPLLTALPVRLLGFDPLDYSQAGILRSVAVFFALSLVSMLLGLMWNRKVWLRALLIFWSIFIVFYTTFFTHGEGFFKGLVAALGYWMSQQTVQRGTQPLYYYAFVQIPVYEYLPSLGMLLMVVIAALRGLFASKSGSPFERPEKAAITAAEIADKPDFLTEESESVTADADFLPCEPCVEDDFALDSAAQPLQAETEPGENPPAHADPPPARPAWYERLFSLPPEPVGTAAWLPTAALLIYWSLMSLLTFSYAGERMPWLTTHITMPMILASGWALGYLVEKTDWEAVRRGKGWLVALLSLVFLFAFSSLVGALLGPVPPFAGKDLVQLQATSTFLLSALGSSASLAGLIFLLKGWHPRTFLKTLLLTCFAVMAVFTFRAAYRAAYINYDNAKEYLVYAHSTRDMKDVLEQVETISKRLYGDKSIAVAYDNDALYPFWWYLRDYPNKVWFGDNITKDLRNSPVILVGSANFAKIEPLVRDDYIMYEYKRMWWPMEAYRNQSFASVWQMLKNPAMRSALWEIWFNRDYSQYAAATGDGSLTLATWSPSDLLRMYIRKDVAAQIWEYGVEPVEAAPKVDPYAGSTISLDPVKVISAAGTLSFSAPRGLAVAPDGSLFAADSRNHRIVHLDANGLYLNSWGGYANVLEGPAPEGLFNEPWGVAVGPDGLVYVTDTWNHRVQVFTPEGKFLRMWSEFLVDGVLDSFWGPRGIAVDAQSRVYVTDTGKQRVGVFDALGKYITQFGSRGMVVGQLDEPVGIAVDPDGNVYVADTWNNRVQVFSPNEDATVFTSVLTWDVDAWTTDSLDNKPFLP